MTDTEKPVQTPEEIEADWDKITEDNESTFAELQEFMEYKGWEEIVCLTLEDNSPDDSPMPVHAIRGTINDTEIIYINLPRHMYSITKLVIDSMATEYVEFLLHSKDD